MTEKKMSRKEFVKKGARISTGLTAMSALSPLSLISCSITNLATHSRPRSIHWTPTHTHLLDELNHSSASKRAVVSIVKIKDDNVAYAVEKAIDLLGGVKNVTRGKEKILLKPNLVSNFKRATTKVEITRAMARVMLKAGKEVTIGEGSAAALGFNVKNLEECWTKNRKILDGMQKAVFDQLGYSEMAEELGIRLVNFHSGDLVKVSIPDGFVFKEMNLHESLIKSDLVCSIPMMKTHQLATVTLGMKNFIGAIPGTVYGSVRSRVHDKGMKVEKTGTDAIVMDLVRAIKPGLVVIDAWYAMEGNGPAWGGLVKMDLIIAGNNPAATDMIASLVMGFDPYSINTFHWARKAKLHTCKLENIEVRGEPVEKVWLSFVAPEVLPWETVRQHWGYTEMAGIKKLSIPANGVS